jgi:hypothetical protein
MGGRIPLFVFSSVNREVREWNLNPDPVEFLLETPIELAAHAPLLDRFGFDAGFVTMAESANLSRPTTSTGARMSSLYAGSFCKSSPTARITRLTSSTSSR